MLRCPQCRTRRASFVSMLKHINEKGHKLCGCGGYHYKHRPGSTYCEENPMAPLYHAMRCADLTDEEIEDIKIGLILESAGSKSTSTECPF